MAVEIPWLSVDGAEDGSMNTRLVSMGLLLVFSVLAICGGRLALEPSSASVSVRSETGIVNRRADIVDRNGRLLATSVTLYSLRGNPQDMMNGALVADELVTIFPELDRDALVRRLSDKSKRDVSIKAGLTPRQRQQVFELGLEGIMFEEEFGRAYPNKELAGHVLGFVGNEGNGLDGVEYKFNDRLLAGGAPLVLSLDANVQYVLETDLAAAVGDYNAQAGAGVVMATDTGEVLAMASWPPIDPNQYSDIAAADPRKLNRVVRAVYELGSVFKPLTIAAALDASIIRPDDVFDVSGPYRVNGTLISDTHAFSGAITVSEIVSASSNIGTAKIASQLGRAALDQSFSAYGLFSPSAIELGGSEAPVLPKTPSQISTATMSYGHGISVTPMAFLGAYAALANAGESVTPTLLHDPEREVDGDRVMSSRTAELVMSMLRKTVTNGTATLADVPGYLVAGKTGTAEKPLPTGGYSETENISSFAAIFPSDRPQYAVLILLDSPNAHLETGRSAAATAVPTTAKIISRIAPMLGVQPRFEPRLQAGVPASVISSERSEL